jgi:hypothetical protein
MRGAAGGPAPSPASPERAIDGAMRKGSGRLHGGPGAWRWVAAGGLALAVVALTLGLEGRDVLWLDESWTGAIVGQRRWSDTFHQIYWDVNAPLYYLLIKLWSGVFGLSDWALRAPSLLAAAATPLAAALAPTPGLGRSARLAWAAVLAFWFPALCFAAEARCYALLLLACTLQTIAFARLMQAPVLPRAAAWASVSALSILLHYDALYLGAVQGFIFLLRQPRRALSVWPAALAFGPAFAWMAYHAPRVMQFARPDIAWYAPLQGSELHLVSDYAADGGPVVVRWLAALAVSALSLRLLPWPAPAMGGGDRRGGAGWAVAAAAVSAVALVGMGMLRPSFTFRYLTPCEPGLLLGLVLGFGRLAGRRAAPFALALLSALYLGVSGWMLWTGLRMAPRRYNFEAASAVLGRAHPQRLVFLWDHPVDPVLHPAQLAALGGFFLHRAGVPVRVDPVVLKPGEDPNLRLAGDAEPSGSAVLWLYDRVVHGTAALRFPPRLGQPGSDLSCRDFGSPRFGVLACLHRADAPPVTPGRRVAGDHQAGEAHPQGG